MAREPPPAIKESRAQAKRDDQARKRQDRKRARELQEEEDARKRAEDDAARKDREARKALEARFPPPS
eukprot:5970348-Pleurochrysis_carterae.AAC.1